MNKRIKMFAMDVDGTLTDGKIYIGNRGEVFKAFDVKDGLGIKKLMNAGILPVIITGRSSEIVTYRCKELGIQFVYQGVKDKLQLLQKIADEQEIGLDEVAYIGDDLNDYEVLKMVGVGFVPNDAISDLNGNGLIRLSKKGGRGAVREAIDRLLL